MFNLKKTALTVLAFSSSVVLADTMGPVCIPGNATVPCANSAWDFAAKALYLRPSYSVVPYPVLSYDPSFTTVNRYNRPNYGWGWGFELEGSYHFNTGNDLNINWYHYSRSDNQAITGINNGVFNVGIGIFADSVLLSNSPKWDAVNLEFGQLVNFGDCEKIRFHGGFQYARIQTAGSISGFGTAAVVGLPSGNYDFSTFMKYNGFGPRTGADLSFNWNNGFNIYGNAAAALLVGSSSFSRISSASSSALITPNISASNTQIVPEVEAKLGASYTCALEQGNLSLDVGWMWINYFNAQTVGIRALGIDGAGSGFGTTSDFGIQGPYLGVKWLGFID